MDASASVGSSTDARTLDDATIETHAERVKADGWTVVENAIAPELVDELNDDLLRLERTLGIVPADNLFEGTRTTRIYNLLVHGPVYERVPIHPNVLPIVEKVLDPGLLISSLSSIAIGPDESAQMIHADDQVIGLPKPHPPIICNTMWAITDFTEENGATRLCPGTHRADHSPDLLEHYDSIPAEMSRGSVLVWVGSLWHGGGANQTETRRGGGGHELLRRFSAPAGEPATRHPGGHRQTLSPAPAGAGRLFDLQRPHRSHRQTAPRETSPRRRRRRPDAVGLRQGRVDLRPPSWSATPEAARWGEISTPRIALDTVGGVALPGDSRHQSS
jgi:hypothetical protein